ncbi:MAG: histidine phosphatase family protein [Thermoanaerobaculia bacterium]|nr:histidine phosphatase family protein [Thermoanaerobaculia bacterium]
MSRFVVLFRHGPAEEHSAEKTDADRSLTADGHAKTKRAARGMREIFPDADTIFSSPLLRAMQTALWLTKAYGDTLKIQVTDALLPAADPALLARLIASQGGRNIIVVGHEPHLGDSFAHLVGIRGSLRADLRKAGGVGIRLDESGKGTLEWMLAPRMLRKLG